jgi:hypothetical protein
MLAQDTGLGALCSLWALYQCGGIDDATAIAAIKHPYAPVRMWAVRLLGDTFGIQRNLGLAPARKGALQCRRTSSPRCSPRRKSNPMRRSARNSRQLLGDWPTRRRFRSSPP